MGPVVELVQFVAKFELGRRVPEGCPADGAEGLGTRADSGSRWSVPVGGVLWKPSSVAFQLSTQQTLTHTCDRSALYLGTEQGSRSADTRVLVDGHEPCAKGSRTRGACRRLPLAAARLQRGRSSICALSAKSALSA